MRSIEQAMVEVLACGGLDPGLAQSVALTGDDPVFATRYRIGATGAAAYGALGIAMAELRERQTGHRPSIAVDVRDAAVSLRGTTYARLDGQPGIKDDTVTGFYQVADGRWNFFHCNALKHQEILLGVLGVPADRAQVAAAARQWNSDELENTVDIAGACAPAVRSRDEWLQLPNTTPLLAEPLIDIRKIGEAPPTGLPSGLPAGILPLSGLRVLDLTRVLAGPTSGRLLAEFGADVIKITSAGNPDFAAHELDTGYAKRKATLNIDAAPGRQEFESLLKDCDVFIQAYRLGGMEKLGFGPEQAAAARPGIVYVSLNAFGFTGPWRGRRGFDTVVQSAAGFAHVPGNGGDPKVLPVSCLDYLAGYLMAFGTLMALQRRAQEGGSYEVRVSLARTGEWLSSMGLLDASALQAPKDVPREELDRLLITVPTPQGRLTRLGPIIRFSDPLLNQLPDWETPAEGALRWLPPRPLALSSSKGS